MKSYIYIVKNDWPEGPWMTEPDKVQWQDPETGLVCLIVRNRDMGGLCGYVGVPPEHPLFKVPYNNVDVNVHGGLTFEGFCQERADGHGICHIPEPGEPEHVWWFGFDCSHYGDSYPKELFKSGGQYRDIEYVTKECTELARQLKELIPAF